MKGTEGLKKAIDDVLGSNTTIEEKRKTKDDIQREKFEKIIFALETLNIRGNILGNDLNVDFSQYDEAFYKIIDELIEITYGKEANDLIYFYIYERINPDGSLNQLEDKDGKFITLMSPTDLWFLIKQINENLEKQKVKGQKRQYKKL